MNLTITFSICVILIKYKIFINVRQLIKRILKEEREKDLSTAIKELLNISIGPKYKGIICKFDAVSPWKMYKDPINRDYQVMVSVIGGVGSNRWPNTMNFVKERDKIVNETWHTIYNFLGVSTDVFLRNVKSCDEVMSEGLHDTSWQNDEGDKITLIDLLDATEKIPVRNISVNKIKPKLLTWDDDDEEIAKIEKSDLQYPILIFVDDDGNFISIIDGHHRAQKAVRHKLKTIKAKLIPINSLPKNIGKVFKHLNKKGESLNESKMMDLLNATKKIPVRNISEEKLPVTPKELINSLPKDLKKLLFKQWGAKQNPKWHPEGNSLKHIIVVIKRAYEHYPEDPNMIMAALFHDLGKMDTFAINPKTGQPTAYGHEDKSTDYVDQFKDWISTFDETDVDEIKYLVKNHMKINPRTWDVMKTSKKEPISSHSAFNKLKGFTDNLDGGGF